MLMLKNSQLVADHEEAPRVSVVLCTHDRPTDIKANLPAIVASAEASRHAVEVIMVDNSPVDRLSCDIAAQAGIDYVLEPVKGLGRARNAGASASAGDVVLFVDDDVLVPTNWVDAMASPLLAHECDVVAGSVVPAAGRVQPWMDPLTRSVLCATSNPSDGAPCDLVGASFGCRRAVLDRIRFDPLLGAGGPYGSGEDIHFQERVRAEGFTINGCSTAPAVHHFDVDRLTYAALCDRASAIGRSSAYINRHCHGMDINRSRTRMKVWRDHLRLCRMLLSSTPRADGISDSEFSLRMRLAHNRQWLRWAAKT